MTSVNHVCPVKRRSQWGGRGWFSGLRPSCWQPPRLPLYARLPKRWINGPRPKGSKIEVVMIRAETAPILW